MSGTAYGLFFLGSTLSRFTGCGADEECEGLDGGEDLLRMC